MARKTRDPAGRAARRSRPGRGPVPVLALLACGALLCGAGWQGSYQGNEAGDHLLVLKEQTGTLTVDLLRVAIGDPAQCQLSVAACPAVADANGFRAGPCRAELTGTEGGSCTGAMDLHLHGTELANNGTVVTSLSVRTSLNDWPVVLQRRACGLGFELAGVLPLLRLARRALRRRSG
jgi:hypothetical protein